MLPYKIEEHECKGRGQEQADELTRGEDLQEYRDPQFVSVEYVGDPVKRGGGGGGGGKGVRVGGLNQVNEH